MLGVLSEDEYKEVERKIKDIEGEFKNWQSSIQNVIIEIARGNKKVLDDVLSIDSLFSYNLNNDIRNKDRSSKTNRT